MGYPIWHPAPPSTGPDNRTEAEKQREDEAYMNLINSMSNTPREGIGWGFLAFLGLSNLFK